MTKILSTIICVFKVETKKWGLNKIKEGSKEKEDAQEVESRETMACSGF